MFIGRSTLGDTYIAKTSTFINEIKVIIKEAQAEQLRKEAEGIKQKKQSINL